MFHDHTGDLLKTEYAYAYNVFWTRVYRINSAYFLKLRCFISNHLNKCRPWK